MPQITNTRLRRVATDGGMDSIKETETVEVQQRGEHILAWNAKAQQQDEYMDDHPAPKVCVRQFALTRSPSTPHTAKGHSQLRLLVDVHGPPTIAESSASRSRIHLDLHRSLRRDRDARNRWLRLLRPQREERQHDLRYGRGHHIRACPGKAFG